VVGALCSRTTSGTKHLARRLSSQFTVLDYDRRGRGDSGAAAPYSISRKVEDLAALIEAVGGHAHLYGHSSGGALVALPDKLQRATGVDTPRQAPNLGVVELAWHRCCSAMVPALFANLLRAVRLERMQVAELSGATVLRYRVIR